MDDKVKIAFDEEYKIRVLDPQKFSKAEELQKESALFAEKITVFNDKINSLVDVLEKHAARIDAQKLRAIGLRLAVENETDQRYRQQKAIQALISEKRAELDRYTSQLQSLEKIEADQKTVLEKITSARM